LLLGAEKVSVAQALLIAVDALQKISGGVGCIATVHCIHTFGLKVLRHVHLERAGAGVESEESKYRRSNKVATVVSQKV
jgi:hypothetical protein